MAEGAYRVVPIHGTVKMVVWEGITHGDTGQVFDMKDYALDSIQGKGTWGGATVTCYGSNDSEAGSPEFNALKDIFGGTVALVTGAKLFHLAAGVNLVYPAEASGDVTTDVDVFMRIRRI